MDFMKTQDILDMVIDAAEESMEFQYTLRDDKRKMLQENCERLDAMKDEFGVESTEMDIEDENHDLIVTLICQDIELEHGTSHPFFSVVSDALTFRFSTEGENLKIQFEFSDLWEMV